MVNAKMMIRLASVLSLRVGQVSLEELGHAEGADLVLPEDGLHLGVGLEVLLVLGVLELVGLEVSPDPLDHLWSGQLLPLLGTDQVGQLSAQSQRLRQSGSLQPERLLLPSCLCSHRLFRAVLFFGPKMEKSLTIKTVSGWKGLII